MSIILHKNIVGTYPDFLVIGAGRSGTTWLYENLKKSDDIWLPPIKEIHYFDRSPDYSSPSFLHEPSIIKRLVGTEKNNIEFRKRFARSLGNIAFKGGLNNLLWFLNFYLGKYNDEWYTSLFKKGKEKVTGDITPAYQILKQDDIRKIYNLIPDCKIIFIIRNPIFRTWSQLRKNNQSKLDYGQIQKVLLSDEVKLRNDYLGTINNYMTFFPPENFLVLYYDEIIEAPVELINKALKFLDVSPIGLNEINKSRINKSPYSSLPEETRELLLQSLRPVVERISKELPNKYTLKWLSEMEGR